MADDVSAVAAALASIAPPGVRTGCRRIDAGDVGALRPEEAAVVSRATPGRRAEFASGRALLRQLVGTEAAIPAGADRAPVLPPGVVASLAHTASIAVAVVAAAGSFAALGVDLEAATALDDDIGRIVLRPDEPGIDVALAFALKEAAYKAWSGLGGHLLEHHDVRLVLDPDDRFHAIEVASATVLAGRHAHVAGHHLAVVAVPTGQPAATSS